MNAVARRWRELGATSRRLVCGGGAVAVLAPAVLDGAPAAALLLAGAGAAVLGVSWSTSTDGPDRRAAEATAADPAPSAEPDPGVVMDLGDLALLVAREAAAPARTMPPVPDGADRCTGDLWTTFAPAGDPVVLWLRTELERRGWTGSDQPGALAASLLDILRSASEPQVAALTGRTVTALPAPQTAAITAGGAR